MAYTKRLEIKINGTIVLWDIDPADSKNILIKNTGAFALTERQLEQVRVLLLHMVEFSHLNLDVHSIEYSDIV